MSTSFINKYILSPKISLALRILSILLVLIFAFWAGMAVGWRKAEFSYRFSDNYYRSFGGYNRSPIDRVGIPDPDDLMSGHGAAGTVVTIDLPTIIVSDRNNLEKTIIVTPDTIIRGGRVDIASTTITDHDVIVVLGVPNSTGQVIAKLIRVMPTTTAMISSSSPVMKK